MIPILEGALTNFRVGKDLCISIIRPKCVHCILRSLKLRFHLPIFMILLRRIPKPLMAVFPHFKRLWLCPSLDIVFCIRASDRLKTAYGVLIMYKVMLFQTDNLCGILCCEFQMHEGVMM